MRIDFIVLRRFIEDKGPYDVVDSRLSYIWRVTMRIQHVFFIQHKSSTNIAQGYQGDYEALICVNICRDGPTRSMCPLCYLLAPRVQRE